MKNLISGENIVLPNTCIRVGINVSATILMDMDLLALPLSSSGQSVSPDSIVHSGKKYIDNGAIILDGRNNDWLFEVNLPFLPTHWNRILFALIFKNPQLARHEKQLIVTIEQIAHFIVPASELAGLLAIRLGEIYRYRHTYKFRALGDGYNAGSEQVARSHGLEELPNAESGHDQPASEASSGPVKENFLNWLFSDRPAVFRVTVLGPQSVGKTSLLAGLHDQLNRINRLSSMKLVATSESSIRLKEHVQQMIDQPWARGIQSWPEIAGTTEHQAYHFQLVSTVTDFQLNIQFDDFPGDDLRRQPERIVQFIRTSNIIFLVIDTPALIAESGRWHETVNAGRQLTDLFKQALQEFEAPKLLLIVPVKCEHYLHQREYQKLLAAVQKEYAGLFNFLGHLKKEIAVAITPVQILGGVHFVGCLDQEKPVFLFDKKPELILYSPRDVEQPLLYSLSFILRGLAGGNRRFIRSEFKEHLEEVIGDFLQHRKQGAEGYRILQGARLL